MRMRRQQALLEIREGECQECGMIGLLINRGMTSMCEGCEQELDLG